MTKTIDNKPAAAKSAITTTPVTPLAAKLAEVKTMVGKLRDEVALQSGRHNDLKKLAAEKEEILLAVEQATMGFAEGKKRLGDIEAGLELLTHSATRRAAPLAQEYAAARAALLELRVSAAELLQGAAISQLEIRQAQARQFLNGMGGTVDPGAWPLIVGPLVHACPVLTALQQHRERIDQWGPPQAAGVLLAEIESALAFIAAQALPVADLAKADELESKLAPPAAIVGFWPHRGSWDVMSLPNDRTATSAIMRSAAGASSLTGCRRIVSLEPGAAPHRFRSPQNAITTALAEDATWIRNQGYGPNEERLLEDASAWLALPV